MPAPEISVVLPVRDADATLDDAVASVLASRDVDLELIAVDDGSSDGTGQRLRTWAARDPRVRVATQSPRGICAALRRGLEVSRADIVARMDADDAMHPDRLAAQLELLRARPDVALVSCGVESFRAGGLAPGYRLYSDWCNALVDPDAIRAAAFVDCPVPHPTWTFRRGRVLELGGYRDADWPEDLDLLYRLLAAGERVAKVDRVLHRWRDHPGRLSRVDPRYDRRAMARVKAHWVGRVHPMRGAVVWGAGKTGRRLARELLGQGLPIEAMLDIAPGRIGRSWREIPILSAGDLGQRAPDWRARGLRVLGAVASRGARNEMRGNLLEAGLDEGADFVMMA